MSKKDPFFEVQVIAAIVFVLALCALMTVAILKSTGAWEYVEW